MLSKLSISAIGDISFEGKYVDKPSAKPFSAVVHILKSTDLVVANLENPLTNGGNRVKGKCTLRGSPNWAGVMRDIGVHLISLANNHMMDYGQEGLLNTIRALNSAGLEYVGAGKNRKEAYAPKLMKIKKTSIAFIARTSVIVSSPSYAGESQPGVAYLDIEETKRNIKACKDQADLVILLIHWGLEEYHYPPPHQRILAKELIEAGADLILGHHPHVLQGVEVIGKSFVAYSLGNFVFDDIYWSFVDEEGQQQYRIVKLTRDKRKGAILRVKLSEKRFESYDFLPTYIRSDGRIIVDDTLERKNGFGLLCSRLHWPGYSFFWRLYSVREEFRLHIIPLIQGKLTWEKLKKFRLKHFRQLLDKVRRSTKITTEKSTNPYE